MIRHKFLIGDILKKVSTDKLPVKAKQLQKTPEGDKSLVPLIAAGVDNQGRVGVVGPNDPTVLHNLITVSANGANSGAAFYQKRKFSILQDAYALRLADDCAGNASDEVYIYLTAVLNTRLKQNGYNNKATWNRIKKYQIELPVTQFGTPDFAYMTKKIRELEAERIRELEAYLKVTGLDDTTLSGSEAAALTKKVIWKKFRIGGVFGKAQLGDTNLKKSDLTLTGDFVVTSGQTNNGILGRTTREAKIFPENTLTIDMFGYAYYRDFPYKMVTHGRVMSLSSDIIKNREVGLFLATVLSRLTDVFSYNNMATWKKLKNMSIMLPVTPNNQIDFTYMQNYIRAIEKQTIKNVVAYKDQVINETRKVVNE